MLTQASRAAPGNLLLWYSAGETANQAGNGLCLFMQKNVAQTRKVRKIADYRNQQKIIIIHSVYTHVYTHTTVLTI